MAKRKMQKLLAFCLAVSMLMGTTALAADTNGSVAVESRPGGGKETIDVVISADSAGKVHTRAPKGTTTESGLRVKYEETAVYDENGKLIEQKSEYTATDDGDYRANGGSSYQSEVVPTDAEITVKVFEDGAAAENAQGSSNTADSVTEPTTPRDELQSENPAEYDQTTIKTTDRTAEVTVNDVTVSTGDPKYVDENGLEVGRSDDGYHFYWSDIYTVDGKSIIDGEASNWSTGGTRRFIVDENGNKRELKSEGVCQRVVAYDNGTPDDLTDDYEIGGLYCVDMSTGIKQHIKYRRANLEDADYYTDEEAMHLRAIFEYGYGWTDGDQDLADIKAMLKDAAENGDEATRALLADMDIDGLTKEEAATATGMAIWHYGNRIVLEEGESLLIQSSENNADVDKLYAYLITLSEETPEEETQIINEEKFIDDMDIVIGSMVKHHEANADKDDDNDIYNVDLRFSLVVEPSQDNDDLVVKVVDNAGNVVKTARIAGEQDEGETFGYAKTETDENGKTVYILDGLQLAENSDTTFNLKLEGAQLLTEGVYIFESQQLEREEMIDRYIEFVDDLGYLESELEYFGGDMEAYRAALSRDLPANYGESQNFIGKYEGMAEVDVNMEVNMTFDVKESTVSAERVWRNEEIDDEGDDDDEIIPPAGDDDDDTTIGDDDVPKDEFPGDDDDDTEMIPEEDTPKAEIPAEDIPEEDVPLADVPKTGDASVLWFALAGLSGAGLVGLNGKKREDEE
ncbi:MAG: Cys-Gln thioester bond-forming surface protein [Butyricicoccus sp.]|nr:Cys-Gln thioester bond-forming surface protein [Butyricicoccus sp.]